MTGNKKECISSFLEQMQHEMPAHNQIVIPRGGYKVDGDGIKKKCQLNTLKSVDYYEDHIKHGFLLVEFSDLLAQNSQITAKIERISASDLSKKDKKDLKKEHYKAINKELVHKYKDSLMIKALMQNTLTNTPISFNTTGSYIIVVAPLDKTLPKDKLIDVSRFLDNLQSKVSGALPAEIFTTVKVLPLDIFAA